METSPFRMVEFDPSSNSTVAVLPLISLITAFALLFFICTQTRSMNQTAASSPVPSIVVSTPPESLMALNEPGSCFTADSVSLTSGVHVALGSLAAPHPEAPAVLSSPLTPSCASEALSFIGFHPLPSSSSRSRDPPGRQISSDTPEAPECDGVEPPKLSYDGVAPPCIGVAPPWSGVAPPCMGVIAPIKGVALAVIPLVASSFSVAPNLSPTTCTRSFTTMTFFNLECNSTCTWVAVVCDTVPRYPFHWPACILTVFPMRLSSLSPRIGPRPLSDCGVLKPGVLIGLAPGLAPPALRDFVPPVRTQLRLRTTKIPECSDLNCEYKNSWARLMRLIVATFPL
mmetsp:Transcript_22197/g.37864  ORF Transcript_22197/g.37864 Transcript_22197/m.37864 type:complete len:342 (-) Transcript_22197:2223-3248(-)